MNLRTPYILFDHVFFLLQLSRGHAVCRGHTRSRGRDCPILSQQAHAAHSSIREELCVFAIRIDQDNTHNFFWMFLSENADDHATKRLTNDNIGSTFASRCEEAMKVKRLLVH